MCFGIEDVMTIISGPLHRRLRGSIHFRCTASWGAPALGHARYANYSVIAGAICRIVILLTANPILSIYSVVIITIFTETIVLSIRVYRMKTRDLWSCV